MQIVRLALAVLAALLLPAAALAQQSTPVVRGTVSPAGQEALPAGAAITVLLQDVSRADAPNTVIAQQTIDAGGRRGPVPFELRYNPVTIVPGGRYVVRADIRVQNVLIYTTQNTVAVLTAGNPTSAAITVQRTSNALPNTSAGALPVAAALLAAAGLAALARRRLA